MDNKTTETQVKTYIGGCHCGKIRFEAEIDLGQAVSRCNCSICTKIGGCSVIVKPSAFRLTAGTEWMGRYDLSFAPNHRIFCKHCGVQVYGAGHIPEIGGDFVGVMVNCLDGVELTDLTYQYWDGRHNNWEAGPRPQPWRAYS